MAEPLGGAKRCACGPELLERLGPKASLASGEAADRGKAWHQTGADLYGFDPTGFDQPSDRLVADIA
jgi:hypothetical protein